MLAKKLQVARPHGMGHPQFTLGQVQLASTMFPPIFFLWAHSYNSLWSMFHLRFQKSKYRLQDLNHVVQMSNMG